MAECVFLKLSPPGFSAFVEEMRQAETTAELKTTGDVEGSGSLPKPL